MKKKYSRKSATYPNIQNKQNPLYSSLVSILYPFKSRQRKRDRETQWKLIRIVLKLAAEPCSRSSPPRPCSRLASPSLSWPSAGCSMILIPKRHSRESELLNLNQPLTLDFFFFFFFFFNAVWYGIPNFYLHGMEIIIYSVC